MNLIIEILKLKSKIFYRQIEEFGIPFFIFIPIALVLMFIFTSLVIENKYGVYIYGVSIISYLWIFQEERLKNEIVVLLFRNTFFLYLVENFYFTLPFLFVIFLKFNLALLFIYFFSIIVFSFQIYQKINFNIFVNLSWFAPDVELIFGFRKYFLIHLLSLAVIILGLSVQNDNIAYFGVILFVLTFGFYYQYVEKTEWLLLSVSNENNFLNLKPFNLFYKSSFIAIIPELLYVLFNFDYKVLMVFPVLYLFQYNMFLLKYAYFKNIITVNFFQSFIIAIAFISFIIPMTFVLLIASTYLIKPKSISFIRSL
jgi:hypothetical protein